jgi:hypothetical protein
MQRAAQDERHRNCIGIHDQDVLQAQGYHTRRRQHLIDWMDGGGHGRSLIAETARCVCKLLLFGAIGFMNGHFWIKNLLDL